MKKQSKQTKKGTSRFKIPYFQSESQRKNTGRKSILFGSKKVTVLVGLVVLASVFGGAVILQKSRDSSAASTMIRNDTFFGSWDNTGAGGILVEGGGSNGGAGFSLPGGNGPGGDPIIRTTVYDGQSNAGSGSPNERSDAQGGTVPLNKVQWITGWERIVQLPSNIPSGASWRWHLMGFWEIHGRTIEQATVQPEIWNDNGVYKRRLNTNAGLDTHRYFDMGPVKLNQWEYVEMGVNYRNDDNGWIEVYRDGKLAQRVTGRMTSENQNGYYKVANYRTASLTGQSTLDISGVRVWDSRPPLPSQLGGSTNPTPTPIPAPTPNPTPTPTPTPSPVPTPNPTPSPITGVLSPNSWSSWTYREAAGGKTVLQPMEKSNSNGLSIILKSGSNRYQNTQYGYYCTVRSASSAQPKSITFTATYNAKTGNTVYFYADQSWNKLWQISDTGGNNVTNTVTVNLGAQKEYCFGNVTKDALNGGRYSSDRFLNVSNYTFKY